MKPIALRFAAAILAVASLSLSAYAQRPRGAASADTGDFTEGNLKFHRVGGFIQVTDKEKNQSAGTIIFPPGGAPTFAPMPGYDIKSAYEKHMSGGASPAPPASTSKQESPSPSATPSPVAPSTAPGFDAASKTVTLSEGRTVTFTDNDNLKLQMPGPAGPKNYALHFHKASAGGFAKGWAGREQGRVGGSLGGGGVTISLESQGGLPGGEVYDTAKGAAFGNSGLEQAKTVIAAVREAVEVAKNNSQPDLAKLNVVKSLLSNNLGL
jgi:hypothetical protein